MNLHNKIKLYKKWVEVHQDDNGFINTDESDSLLFSGLLNTATNDVVLAAAMLDGNWYRRPTQYPEPYKAGESKSTISRDMLLGLMIGAWFDRDDRDWVFKTITSKALRSFGIMGRGYPSRTFIGSLVGTAAEAEYQCGGKNHRLLRKVPYYLPKNVVGFEAHLAVLHVYLREQLGLIDRDAAQQYYMHHAERQPLNPLFLALSGQFIAAEAILMDESLWPANRLPTTLDRREPWLLQRDFGNDWCPVLLHGKGDQGHEHNGADFIFCATLLEKLREEQALFDNVIVTVDED